MDHIIRQCPCADSWTFFGEERTCQTDAWFAAPSIRERVDGPPIETTSTRSTVDELERFEREYARARVADASGRWLVIGAKTPFLVKYGGGGLVSTEGSTFERLIRWMAETRCSDSVIWLEKGEHDNDMSTDDAGGRLPDDTLVSMRANGGVTIQISSSAAFGPADWSAVERAVSQAVGPLHIRAQWARSMNETLEFCQRVGDPSVYRGDVMGCLGDYENHTDPCWPTMAYAEAVRSLLGLTQRAEECAQVRVRQAVDVAEFRCRRAKSVIAKGVRENRERIMARLWHPSGRIMRRRFESSWE